MAYDPYPTTLAIPYADVPPFYDFWALSPGAFFSPPYYTTNPNTIFQGWCKARTLAHVGFQITQQVFAAPGQNPTPPALPETWEAFDGFCVSRYGSHPWSLNTLNLGQETTTLDPPSPWTIWSNSYRSYAPAPAPAYFYSIEAGPVYRWTDYSGNKYYDYTILFHWDHLYVHLVTLTAGRSEFHQFAGGIAPIFGALVISGLMLAAAGSISAATSPGRRRKKS